MANTEAKQQYEGAILQRRHECAKASLNATCLLPQAAIKNSERLVIVESDIAQLKQDVAQLKQDMAYIKPKVESIDKTLGSIKWILVTIALAIVANIFSQPILALFE